jgi:hypothetical protein
MISLDRSAQTFDGIGEALSDDLLTRLSRLIETNRT